MISLDSLFEIVIMILSIVGIYLGIVVSIMCSGKLKMSVIFLIIALLALLAPSFTLFSGITGAAIGFAEIYNNLPLTMKMIRLIATFSIIISLYNMRKMISELK